MLTDTIFALSTVYGKSGIAVFRISGKDALNALNVFKIVKQIAPREAFLVKFYDDVNDVIDEGIIIYFPRPNSFTGEDVIEINTHGSIAVINAMHHHLSNYFRIAEPGEFAKRAFINEKLDLTASEGLVALLDAQTSIQRKQALTQIFGYAKKLYDEWREQIISAMAYIEAFLDFPDEDIPELLIQKVNITIQDLLKKILIYLDDGRKGQKIKSGIRITIFGPPNAGKSTLFNYLVNKDASIISSVPGTTRDVIEVNLDIGGFLVTIQDTAGVHDTDNEIEKEGIRRTNAALMESDLVLFLIACDQMDYFEYMQSASNFPDGLYLIYVITKCDSGFNYEFIQNNQKFLPISVQNNIGMDLLYERILDFLKNYNTNFELPIITEERHRIALMNASKALEKFLHTEASLEIVAEYLREASRYIGSITGVINTEEILDLLFSKLCIGK